MQDPGKYLENLEITLACPVVTGELARLDQAHRVFVNWETYFVSSAAALAEFSQSPWRYTGVVTDPVSGKRFQPDESSPQQAHEGRTFYFSSEETLVEFAAAPESYATPMLGMVEKTE